MSVLSMDSDWELKLYFLLCEISKYMATDIRSVHYLCPLARVQLNRLFGIFIVIKRLMFDSMKCPSAFGCKSEQLPIRASWRQSLVGNIWPVPLQITQTIFGSELGSTCIKIWWSLQSPKFRFFKHFNNKKNTSDQHFNDFIRLSSFYSAVYNRCRFILKICKYSHSIFLFRSEMLTI